MKKILYLVFVMLFIYCVNAQVNQPHTNGILPKKETNNYQLSYKIITNSDYSFGYDILDHNHTLVHQPNIPGLSGNNGFKVKTDAEKIAKLVMYKIQHNLMPPSVTINEIDSLKIKL